MIRKPPADWQRPDESAAVRAVQAALKISKGTADLSQRTGSAVQGAICFFFAIVWGFVAISSSLWRDLPSMILIGAMVAFMVWRGRRAFAKARATSG